MDYSQELATRSAAGLLRSTWTATETGAYVQHKGQRLLNLSGNDYLGLARHPDVLAGSEAALRKYGAGATASRLVCGTLAIHEELEQALARHKGYPAALLYGSGFLANLGLVSCRVTAGDVVYADKLIHASLIDAIRVSGARMIRFRHNDAAHLAERIASTTATGRQLCVIESVYSMDGDLAPLCEIAACCKSASIPLLVDEAHATGVFGQTGAGRVAELGLQQDVDLCMGTLSKALGGYGGYVACGEEQREYLVNFSRSFIYSTALPPSVAGAALAALRVLEQDPGRGQRLLAHAENFRQTLQEAGLNTLDSASQIIPIRVGDNRTALDASTRLRAEGILAIAIRPPTVPVGEARLRLSLSLDHSPEELSAAALRISEAVQAAKRRAS